MTGFLEWSFALDEDGGVGDLVFLSEVGEKDPRRCSCSDWNASDVQEIVEIEIDDRGQSLLLSSN